MAKPEGGVIEWVLSSKSVSAPISVIFIEIAESVWIVNVRRLRIYPDSHN